MTTDIAKRREARRKARAEEWERKRKAGISIDPSTLKGMGATPSDIGAITPTLGPGVDLGYGPGVPPPPTKVTPTLGPGVDLGWGPGVIPGGISEQDAWNRYGKAISGGDYASADTWMREALRLHAQTTAKGTVYAPGIEEALEGAVAAGMPGYESAAEARAAFGLKPGAAFPVHYYKGMYYPEWVLGPTRPGYAWQEGRFGPTQEYYMPPPETEEEWAEYARRWGFPPEPEDLGLEGWTLERDTYISPEGEEFTLEELEGLAISPTGELYTPEEVKESIAKLAELEASLESTGLFPDKDIEEVLAYSEEDPIGFMQALYEVGQNEDSNLLLTQLGFTDEEIGAFWTGLGPRAQISAEVEFMDLITRLQSQGGWKGLNLGPGTIASEAYENPEQFIKELQRLGPNADTLRMLELMGITGDDVSDIFPWRVQPEGWETIGEPERAWWATKAAFFQVLAGAERYVFAPWRLAVAEILTQAEFDKEPEDIEFLDKVYAAANRYGTLGYVVEPEVMEAYDEWIDAKGGTGTAIWWISEITNPAFWVPVGGLALRVARIGLLARIPVFGKAISLTAKGVNAAERGLAWPIAKPMQLVARGVRRVLPKRVVPIAAPKEAQQAMNFVAQEGRIPLPEVPTSAETLAFIEKNHPGRLGKGKWRGWRGLQDSEATIKGARLYQVSVDELGASYADFAVSQLDLISDLKSLAIKEGVVTRGIISTKPGAPMVKGKPSMAWGDVFENYKLYTFADPQVPKWIETSYGLIDDVTRFAETHGLVFDKAFYNEMSHYFPRGAVKGLEGVVEGNFVRVGAGLPGAKIAAQKHRVFEFMEEGLGLGYKYGTPQESLGAFVQGMYRLVGNKEAINILSPLMRPLAKETEFGAVAILRAQTARKFANRAEHLEVLIQRIRRGEAPHASTMAALERNFPEFSPRMKSLVEMPAGAEKEALVKELLAEARVIKSTAQAEAARAVMERVSLVEAASHRGFTEGIVDIPGIRNRIFTDITVNGKRVTGQEVARMVEKTFKEQAPRWLGLTSEINRGFVTLQAALDTSAPFIQGTYTVGVDVTNLLAGRPTKIWPKTAVNHIRVMLQPSYLKSFRAKHIRTYMKYPDMITASDLSDFYKGLGMINKTVGRIPVVGEIPKFAYGRTGIGFAAWGEMARVHIIESMERAWIRGGGTRAELVEFSHLTTGLISTRGIGVGATQRAAESTGFFAMRYLRANLMFLRQLFKGGMTGKMVRRTFGGAAAGWLLAYCATSATLGQEPKLNPLPKSAGGDGAEFLSVEVAGQNIGMPGFLYGFIRMFGGLITVAMDDPHRLISIDWENVMANHPELRWLLYKTSPLVSTTYELVNGRDVIGNRIDTVGDYLETVYENFLSIALQSIITQDPPANAWAFVAELMGLRTFPEGAWDKFSDAADELIAGLVESKLDETQIEKRRDGTLGWSDLDPLQKEELKAENPELQELFDNYASAKEKRESDEWRNWRLEKDRLNKLKDDAEAAAIADLRDKTKDYNIVDLRNTLKNTAGENHTRWEELKRDFPKVYEIFEESRLEKAEDAPLFEQAYNEWYDWVLYGSGTEDAAGNVIWSVVERRRKEWMEKWGEEYYEMILDLREYGYADKDDLLFKIWEDKQRLHDYWEIEDNKERLAYREDPNNLDIEASLVFLGYVSTIRNPEAEEIVREWCDEFNVDIRDIPAFSKLMIPEKAMGEYGITDPNLMRAYSGLPLAGWDRERFLQANPEFYRYWVEELEHTEVDFTRVPSEEVETFWNQYQGLDDTAKKMLRWENPELDAWLVIAKGYTPIRDYWTPPEGIEPTVGETPSEWKGREAKLKEQLGR